MHGNALKTSEMTTEAQLNKIKHWYLQYYPLCGLCGHAIRDEADLAHIVRRSYSDKLQTVRLNCMLAHRECHEDYDNNPALAQFLPRMPEVLYIAWRLDPEYFYQIADKFPLLSPFFERFPEVEIGEIEHHGELLTLQYLVQ